MDWSLILGIAGIAVSIIVGWLTYYLADKRQRRNRFLAAKHSVVSTLSRSLSEETVPSAELVRATIRSVLREENAADLSAVSVEEVIDDLIRQVTSDPFLAAERRKELQASLLGVITAVAQEKTTTVELETREDKQAPNYKMLPSLAAAALGGVSAMFTLLMFGNVFARLPQSSGPNSNVIGGEHPLIAYLKRGDLLSSMADPLVALLTIGIVVVTGIHWLSRKP